MTTPAKKAAPKTAAAKVTPVAKTAPTKADAKATAAAAAAKAKLRTQCANRVDNDGNTVYARGVEATRNCTKPRRDEKSSFCVAHEAAALAYRKARAAAKAAANPKPAKAAKPATAKSTAKVAPNSGGQKRVVAAPSTKTVQPAELTARVSPIFPVAQPAMVQLVSHE